MIKILLASKENRNGDIEYNKNVITETMINHSKEADIIVFGEAFLQGFYALTSDFQQVEWQIEYYGDIYEDK